MDLTVFAAQTVYISRAKLYKMVVKCETHVFFLTFGFFSRCTFLSLEHFISPTTYPFKSVLSVVLCIYKIHVFDEALFLLAIVAMITEKMSFSYFHDELC